MRPGVGGGAGVGKLAVAGAGGLCYPCRLAKPAGGGPSGGTRGATSMLEIHDGRGGPDRRAFLRIGSLALGGLSLAGLLAARARAAGEKRLLTDKSVIFLFLHGGPSQTETFDPKMGAPDGVRSATGEVATRLPGVTFG